MKKNIMYKYNEVYRSPYETNDLKSSLGRFDFYFSTGNNLKRFESGLKDNLKKVKFWTKIYVGENFVLDNLLNYVYTYVKTETRGFRVELNGDNLEVFKCKEELVEMLNSIYSKKLY